MLTLPAEGKRGTWTSAESACQAPHLPGPIYRISVTFLGTLIHYTEHPLLLITWYRPLKGMLCLSLDFCPLYLKRRGKDPGLQLIHRISFLNLICETFS